MEPLALLAVIIVIALILTVGACVLADSIEPFQDHPDLKNIQWPVKPADTADIERRSYDVDKI